MSQKDLDVVRGLMQAAADSYDGALDDKGEPIKIGLKREEGHLGHKSDGWIQMPNRWR